MAIIKHKFETEAAAYAFSDGIEYVNDSSITVLDVSLIPGEGWVVKFKDEDAEADE